MVHGVTRRHRGVGGDPRCDTVRVQRLQGKYKRSNVGRTVSRLVSADVLLSRLAFWRDTPVKHHSHSQYQYHYHCQSPSLLASWVGEVKKVLLLLLWSSIGSTIVGAPYGVARMTMMMRSNDTSSARFLALRICLEWGALLLFLSKLGLELKKLKNVWGSEWNFVDRTVSRLVLADAVLSRLAFWRDTPVTHHYHYHYQYHNHCHYHW